MNQSNFMTRNSKIAHGHGLSQKKSHRLLLSFDRKRSKFYVKGAPNMILAKVICFVNVRKWFSTFPQHFTFTRIMLGSSLVNNKFFPKTCKRHFRRTFLVKGRLKKVIFITFFSLSKNVFGAPIIVLCSQHAWCGQYSHLYSFHIILSKFWKFFWCLELFFGHLKKSNRINE